MITHHQQLPPFIPLGGHRHSLISLSLDFISNSDRRSPQLCSQPLQMISQLCGRVNGHNLLSVTRRVILLPPPTARSRAIAVSRFVISNCIPHSAAVDLIGFHYISQGQLNSLTDFDIISSVRSFASCY